MSTTQKKKLCWNCEGRVSLEEENCPYCAVYLGPAPGEKGEQDILAPPYRLVDSDEEEQKVPESPYAMENDQVEENESIDFTPARKDFNQIVLPLSLLSAGTLFFLFGLILWLFSVDGTFTLTWNAHYWYVYSALALLMLFIGWKVLKNFEGADEHLESDS